ncbi:[Fe-S]-binding protein [Verrucomicrobia bacterium IMCC26134]|nr:[Fe-S]-binding protein [Verrucomicrobia bacterium IMCC26134]
MSNAVSLSSLPAPVLPPVSAAPDQPLPEGVRVGNEQLVCLTEAAGRKVSALIAREKQGGYLRVAISGGGCNGLSYKLRFTPEGRRGDILVATAGVRALVDAKTALYLKGTHIDYSNQLIAGGFKFTNPNAKASCSCGESFSV